MKIRVDNKEYNVTQLVMAQLCDFVEQKALEIYNKSPSPIQAAFMIIVRHELSNLEKKHPDKKDVLRPPKRKDPVEHIIGLIKEGIIELSKEQVIEARINADNEIITLELGESASTGGGPLAVSRD